MRERYLAPLERLGWSRVCLKAPNFAAEIGHRILTATEWDKGRRFKSDLAALERILRGVREVSLGFHELSEEQSRMINFQASRYAGADIEAASEDHISRLFEILEPIASSMWLGSEELVENIQKLPHHKKNWPAFEIAEAIAELYVVGVGTRPTLGKDQASSEINGKFAEVTFEVFDILDVSVSRQTIQPFKRAVARLDAEKMRRLQSLRMHGGRKASLVTGEINGNRISLFYDFDLQTGRRLSDPSKGE
ncbi:hypothetical protein [Celeribacter sp.]|uniref:hypothetical protein n=1 Tax=Celeribacter sp. TaxID=1890673 RepID=UPI003A91C206